jgi:hypothetical protein
MMTHNTNHQIPLTIEADSGAGGYQMDTGFSIFLDFDGVMVTKFSSPTSKYEEFVFDPVCVENLKSIIEQMKTKFGKVNIIITSGWRYDLSEATINDLLLRRYGLHTCLSESDITYLDRLRGKVQGITQYIQENQLTPQQCVILDDEYLGDELAAYQMRTRSEDGIRGISTIERLR